MQYPMGQAPVNITYSLQFEEIQARVEMGLSQEQYDALPGTPAWVTMENPGLSKCDVLVWYRLSRLIPAVVEQAANKKARR